MKPALKLTVVAVVSLLIGFTVGRLYSERRSEEDLLSVLLADAALRTTQCTSILTAIREGHAQPATERLEMHLDLAVLDIARHYSAARDEKQGAARAIRAAREYRSRYPRTPERGDVKSALALPVPESGP